MHRVFRGRLSRSRQLSSSIAPLPTLRQRQLPGPSCSRSSLPRRATFSTRHHSSLSAESTQVQPSHHGDTIYALSTAAGKAGIAVIRISGPACQQVSSSQVSMSHSRSLCATLNADSVIDLPCSVPGKGVSQTPIRSSQDSLSTWPDRSRCSRLGSPGTILSVPTHRHRRGRSRATHPRRQRHSQGRPGRHLDLQQRHHHHTRTDSFE